MQLDPADITQSLAASSRDRGLATYQFAADDPLVVAAQRVFPDYGRTDSVIALIDAALDIVTDSDIRLLAQASLRRPPFQGSSIRRRLDLYADIIAQNRNNLRGAPNVPKEPVQSFNTVNTLRTQVALPRLADAIIAVVRKGPNLRLTDNEMTELRDKYRPKAPIAALTTTLIKIYVDDLGRTTQTVREDTHVALEATGGTHTIVVRDNWKGNSTELETIYGCELLYEESLGEDYKRIVLATPPMLPGDTQIMTYRTRNHYAANNKDLVPGGGNYIIDCENDNFEAHLTVQFGGRKPKRAWHFGPMPRMAAPGQPTATNILAADTNGKLGHIWRVPTEARKAYGVQWEF